MKTVKQIAKHYGVSDRTVRNWLKEARKELGSDGIGSYEKGRLVFTHAEAEKLRTYGADNTPEPRVEVFHPEVSLDAAMVPVSAVQQAQPLVPIHIESVTFVMPSADTTVIDGAADGLQNMAAKAFQGIADVMRADLIQQVNVAKAQNRYGVMGAQAQAATDALKEVSE